LILASTGLATTSPYISVGASDPWPVTQQLDVIAGYSENDFRIKCYNAHGSSKTFPEGGDSYPISQTMDCTTHVFAAATQKSSPLTLSYSETTSAT
jgi:hypothetical protein